MLDYRHCTLCPRRCGVDRTAGQLGFCRMPDQIHAARAALHYWEEPVISGSYGSGAVFFSGCTLRCAFCQNGVISQENFGKPLSPAGLRAAFERLIDEGCQNINLVTPTHFLPSILPALTPKLPVPVVYNCGGYESVETLRQLEGLVDIYLPDFKYSDDRLAAKLSAAPDYAETAAAAIREMYRQVGAAVIEDEQMTRGVIIRHLVLPGCIDNSLGVLDWIAEIVPEKGRARQPHEPVRAHGAGEEHAAAGPPHHAGGIRRRSLLPVSAGARQRLHTGFFRGDGRVYPGF